MWTNRNENVTLIHVRLYLDGSPGMWREEGHRTNSASFHRETQQEVKLLIINHALLEQYLRGRTKSSL